MNKYPSFAAIILAAGMGTRMGIGKTKQTLNILGKSVLSRTLEVFDSSDYISSIIVVTRDSEREFVSTECEKIKKPFTIVNGGSSRAESAALGFSAVDDGIGFVMIHDAARCLVSLEDVSKVAQAALEYGAATAARRVTDTVKKCDENGKICYTVPRETLWMVQTPQAFSCEVYRNALSSAGVLDSSVTDDNMLVENSGVYSTCVETSSENIKITEMADIALAEYILRKRESEE